MLRNLDFNNIRPLGSLSDGFEELVCQLAHRMDVPGGNKFVRNGRPDGGVECYWELDNGDRWMWQAKFFSSTPGASQFEQISNSVETALRFHRNVKRFYIALPQDLPDDGKDSTKSARKRYEEKVAQWNKIDGAENTEFIYWGKHEILSILGRKENEGLVYFWFNKNEFTEKDFDDQNKKAICDLGTRYTPELNVELDIAKPFDGMSRNTRFEERCKKHFTEYKKAWQSIRLVSDDLKTEEYRGLGEIVSEIIDDGARIVYDGIEEIPFDSIRAKIGTGSKLVQVFIDYLEDEQKKQPELKDVDYSYVIRNAWEFYHESNRLADYLGCDECKAANLPVILLEGEAGAGKSHLLADIVEGRGKEGRYSLFFLGQHFNADEDPWTQLFKQLKFTGSEDEFLQALEAKAEASGRRVVIFIDALNEGGGKVLWNRYVASFINQIKKHPWVGLVMSFRSTYSRAIFGDERLAGVLLLTHSGFENRSLDAIKLFFKNSNISLPSVPLLLPEFKNPLFLKLFCEGLHKNGLSRIDEGMRGISSVFNLFIEGVEKELSSPKKKDYMPELHIVRKAVNALIDYQVNNSVTEVPFDEAYKLTDNVKTDKFSSGELLYELVSYGVLARDVRYKGEDEYEIVYISYERFNDFLTAQRLLEVSESAEKAVNKLIKKKHDLLYYGGIVESFAIILPEKVGHEIYEVIPEYEDNEFIVGSVMKSLLWRKKSTIDKKLLKYFKKGMNDARYINFIRTLIQVGPTAGHLFNADFLHTNLMKLKMAERDYRWSLILGYICRNSGNPIDTLITWVREDFAQMEIDGESKYLTAIILCWFTSCMDRRIRDYASKGLIALVRNDAGLMLRLLDKFDGVDDPYVVERVYAAAYGCALLSDTTDQLVVLAKSVYNHIFDVNGEVYPNALVRDYAKGIIEYALTKHPDLILGDRPFAPPYKSSFPEAFPTDEETKSYSKKDENGKYLTPGIDAILESMVTEHGYSIYGDFGRYVFQNSLDAWDFDPQKLSNLAVKWILGRYGYKEDWFGKYDNEMGRGRMRRVYPGERVGKKYQWIALHEMVARLSDNYPMHDHWNEEQAVAYNGTWEPYIRDFDPTMMVRGTGSAWYEAESRYWWNSLEYSGWNCSRGEWVKKYDNLPDPVNVIESVDENGVHWLALNAFATWKEPYEEDGDSTRELWYQIRSYIVDEGQFPDFEHWAHGRSFIGRWMPEESNRYEMFGREYYWSSAYDYFEKNGLTKREVFDKDNHKKIVDVELPCVNFLWESQFDYSKPNAVSYLKPSRPLFVGMDMRYSEVDGELVDAAGKLLCFDASANHNSHGYFLVRKEAFLQYLKSNHKRILWALIGEKILINKPSYQSEGLELSGTYYLGSHDEVKGLMAAYFDGEELRKPEPDEP